MTREQTGQVLAIVRMVWPHSNLGGDAGQVVGLWHSFLESFAMDDIEGAVRELAASGREHAPPVGVVAQTAAARASDLPEWDQAWAEVDRLIRRFGYANVPPDEAFSHRLIAMWARPAWKELCSGPAPGTNGHGTHHAQQREAFKAMRARVTRDVGLAALNAPRTSTLKRLPPTFEIPSVTL